ncbi:hypothetical protein FGO68_gene11588 [Halteria grandinella]|uniref:Uncharacterized protein n=1 Tax=Halteria grandinella TaxID=5974 RepID=A0A8J8SZ19_HALGN|nr:hypothetical protein FGO68_gene11588 [Halteria grandinella]
MIIFAQIVIIQIMTQELLLGTFHSDYLVYFINWAIMITFPFKYLSVPTLYFFQVLGYYVILWGGFLWPSEWLAYIQFNMQSSSNFWSLFLDRFLTKAEWLEFIAISVIPDTIAYMGIWKLTEIQRYNKTISNFTTIASGIFGALLSLFQVYWFIQALFDDISFPLVFPTSEPVYYFFWCYTWFLSLLLISNIVPNLLFPIDAYLWRYLSDGTLI